MSFIGKARNYKLYLSVSCGVTDKINREYFKSKLYEKDSCDLRYTTADCDFFYNSLKEHHYDTGVKEKHVRLQNPTVEELKYALKEGVNYLNQFSEEENWCGGEIIFIFSGHGVDESGAICLKDRIFSARDLAQIISEARVKNERRIRLNIILDSCYSGAFLINLIEEAWNNFTDEIFLCDMWSSSSFDEVSFEDEERQHGLFTYAWKSKQEVMDEIGGALHSMINYREKLKTVEELTEFMQNPIIYVNGGLSQGNKMIYVNELEQISSDKIMLELKRKFSKN